jgi:beta-N-acetylhexosaminidase
MVDGHLGQLFVFGFEEKRLSSEFEVFLKENSTGGIILFERNFDSIADIGRLVEKIRSLLDVPPLVMIDQEVRGVNRIKENMPMLSDADVADPVGALGTVPEAFRETAKVLTEMGINVQLAPVVDLALGAERHVLKGRCLGTEVEKVAELGALAVEAIQSEGISACAKHFPGLGRAGEDPHHRLSQVEISKEEWSKTDAVPFKRVIAQSVDFIMSTHMIHTALDAVSPATISKRTINDWLLRELGFHGLLITDDLSMKGISGDLSVPEVAVKALSAGHHLLLICDDLDSQKRALESVREAYASGVLDRERIDGAIIKVLDFKKRYAHA